MAVFNCWWLVRNPARKKNTVWDGAKTPCFNSGRNYLNLGGGFNFNPYEKYARQIGSSPQVGVKIINIWNHHPAINWLAGFLPPTEAFLKNTLLQTKIACRNRPGPKRKFIVQPSIFKNYIYFREGTNHRHIWGRWNARTLSINSRIVSYYSIRRFYILF